MTGDHEQFDELAVGWALHALEPEDETVFTAHLAGCTRCTATVAATTEVMAAMAADLPAAEPSPELRSRLRTAVAGAEQQPAPRDRAPATVAPVAPSPASSAGATTRWRRALPALLAAAAVAVIVGLGVWTVVLGAQREDLQETVAAQQAVVEALSSPGHASIARMDSTDGTGRQVATVVAREDQVQVITSGLSANDAGTTSYVVWGLGADAPVALGAFDVDGAQTAVQTVGSGQTGLDQYATYGISLEPGQEPPAEPSDVVATGQVTS